MKKIAVFSTFVALTLFSGCNLQPKPDKAEFSQDSILETVKVVKDEKLSFSSSKLTKFSSDGYIFEQKINPHVKREKDLSFSSQLSGLVAKDTNDIEIINGHKLTCIAKSKKKYYVWMLKGKKFGTKINIYHKRYSSLAEAVSLD